MKSLKNGPLPSNARMVLYAWRNLDRPGDVKVGERWSNAYDYVQGTHDYIRKPTSQGKYAYLARDGRIEVVHVWDASKAAKKVNRFYEGAMFDKYVIKRLGYRIDNQTEFVRPPCKPEDAGQWVINRVTEIITGARVNFPLRDEQSQAVKSIVRYFRKGGTDYLLNAKMRFGKTFTAYNVARELKAKNVLVVTFKPAVRDQWMGELLDHKLFKNFDWVSADDFSKDNPITLANNGKTQVLFASAQDFNDFAKKDNKNGKWSLVRNHKFDLVIYDEHHYGAESKRSQKALSQLNYKWLLACSGTPIKSLLRGSFGPDNTYTWSYVDEQKKRQAEEKKGWPAKPVYRWLPKMFIHRMHIPLDEKEKVLSQYPDEPEGFTMGKMFNTTGVRRNASFVDIGTVSHFLNLLCGEVRSKGMNIFRKLEECHIELRHTAWFLPSVNAIYAMEKLLKVHPFFKDYTVVTVSSDDYSASGAPMAVRQAITQSSGTAGTITLSFMQMNTGVTVPEWTAVLMLNDMKEATTYIQTIFRCQSSWKLGQKEECHVIDFNPARVVQMAYEYNSIVAKPGEDAVAATKEWLDYATMLDHTENGVVTVDAEMFTQLFAVEGDFSATFSDSRTINMDKWSPELDALLTNLLVSKISKKGINLSENGLKPGKNAVIKKKKSEKQRLDPQKVKAEKLKAALAQLPLVLVLTEEKEQSFDQLLKNAAKHLTLPSAWSNFKQAVHALTVGCLLTENTGITTEGWQQLLDAGVINANELNKKIMSLNTLMKKNPEKVTERLVSPNVLVKKHGVVFTPMSLVNEMFDALPKHVWTDKNLKWLEPCVGSGNFALAILNRLMAGLASAIPNEQKRRQHILENMLYMVELLPTNCLLTARRLDAHGEYKLNLSCGNTLKHNFVGMKFDVVVMNPPYDNVGSGGKTPGGARKVWMNFVQSAVNLWLDSDGYLLCIHPTSWRTIESGMWKSTYQIKQVATAKLNLNVDWSVGIKTDWYVLQNRNYTAPTSVIYSTGTEQMDFRKYDGLADDVRVEYVRSKLVGKRLGFKSITSHHASGKNVHPTTGQYRIQNTSSQVLFSNKRHVWQTLEKILVSTSGYLNPFYDSGKLGVTQNTFALFVANEQEADYIIRLLNSKLYRFIVKSYKTSGYTHIKLLNSLPYPKGLLADFTDADLYTHFSLTQDEIALVESTVK